MAEYIEREAALNRLCQENCGHDYNGKCYNCYTGAFIEQYPAADVAPVVHGEWLDCENHNDIEQCSVCGMIYRYPTFYRYNYCPNCGARMDGE